MAVAALITWVVTALGGFAMVGLWAAAGGTRAGSNSRLAPGLVFGHLALAATGLVLWIIYVIVDKTALAWIAFILLLPVAALGFTMLARWIPARRGQVAEARIPPAIVVGHGLFAVSTLVLVLLAALEVGGS